MSALKELIKGLALAYNKGLRYRESRQSGVGEKIIDAVEYLANIHNNDERVLNGKEKRIWVEVLMLGPQDWDSDKCINIYSHFLEEEKLDYELLKQRDPSPYDEPSSQSKKSNSELIEMINVLMKENRTLFDKYLELNRKLGECIEGNKNG
jgi:hypothetical protein